MFLQYMYVQHTYMCCGLALRNRQYMCNLAQARTQGGGAVCILGCLTRATHSQDKRTNSIHKCGLQIAADQRNLG